jgi:hypothetical protein
VYANRIKLYKYANNQIKLLFKDNDQKSVNFAGYTVQFNIFKNQNSAAKSVAYTIPVPSGLIPTPVYNTVLSINNILDDLEPGLYNYSINAGNEGNSDVIIYSDDNYSVVGELEIAVRQQTTVQSTVLAPVSGVSNAAAANSTLHTFQFNYSNFTGTVNFQASLDVQPGSWFTFDTVTPVSANTNVLYNYTGSYIWVRVQVTTVLGTVSNILYLS